MDSREQVHGFHYKHTKKEKREIDTRRARCDFFSCREIFKEKPSEAFEWAKEILFPHIFFEKLQLGVTALCAQPVISEACAAIAWMPKHLHLVHKSIFSSKSFPACLSYLPCLRLVVIGAESNGKEPGMLSIGCDTGIIAAPDSASEGCAPSGGLLWR